MIKRLKLALTQVSLTSWLWIIIVVGALSIAAHGLRYEPMSTEFDGLKILWDRWEQQYCVTGIPKEVYGSSPYVPIKLCAD